MIPKMMKSIVLDAMANITLFWLKPSTGLRIWYNKICQSRKVVRPAPTVRYEEARREEIRFDETDADWDVLNEAIAIAKREAVELLKKMG